MRMGIAALAALLAVCTANVPAAQAEDARIDSLDVLQSGFYTANDGRRENPRPGPPRGHVNAITDINFLDPQPTETAKTGTRMGVRFNVVGTPSGARRGCGRSGSSPNPAFTTPRPAIRIANRAARSRSPSATRFVRGYALEKPFEVVKGIWRLELSQDGRKLLERSFEIK